MALRSKPTARQLRLAVELRRLRDTAGLTSRQAADLLGVTAPVISQIESGIAGVSEQRLRRLAGHYGCADEEFIDALAAMAADRTRGWWEEYRELLPASFLDLAELEHHATHRGDVDFLHVPGLLQTEDYARALFSCRVPTLPEEQVELRVRHRMLRRAILERTDPVPYEVLVHEAALRIRVGGRVASRAQLRHILELSEADHVSVRVIPFALDDFADLTAAMVYVGGAVPRLDTVVRDGPHGVLFIDAEPQLDVFRPLFRRVEAASLDAARSRDLIRELAKEL